MSESKYRHTDQRAEIDDFIGIHPNWLLRSGISIVALVLVAIFCLSYFIQYPDKIVARGILSSENPPIEIKSKVGGVIDKLLVADQSNVTQNDPILYIKNTAASDDIQVLETFVNKFQEGTIRNSALQNKIPRGLNLGDLEDPYGQLILKIDEYSKILDQSDILRQVESMEKEINNISQLNASVEKEKNILNSELELVKVDAERSTQMLAKGIISAQEKEQADSKLLQYQQRMERLSSNIINNNVRKERLRLEQIQLEEARQNEIKTYEFEIAKLISFLNSNMARWKDDFYLVAPASGKLELDKNIVASKSISRDESIGYIVNQDAGERFISISVPAAGIGKIQRGDAAMVKFDAFPHKEFGIIQAKVHEIAVVPYSENGLAQYDVELSLPQNLTTTYDRKLPFQANASITAEIITNDQSVLDRIFNQFKDLMKN
jgi:multidrug resistance efflux pump